MMVILIIGGVTLIVIMAFWLVGERGRFVLPSSMKMMRERGLRRCFSLSALHAYIYGRWTKQYVRFFITYTPVAFGLLINKWLPDRYHGKILTNDHAKAIITLNVDIPLKDLEYIIPYPSARSLVLNASPEIVLYECPCRHARANPCKPTQVCMVIGQPFVDFILEHHPKTSRKVTQAEALAILEKEHERGHLHTAWFKDDCLGRFYAICNCCKCCCGGLEAMKNYGVRLLISSGYISQIDKNRCTVCEKCVAACPFNALSLEGKDIRFDWERCMGCGVCTGQCSLGAVSLVRDEKKGVPLDVRLLGN